MFRRFSVNFMVVSILLDAVVVVGVLAVMARIRPFLNTLPFATEVLKPLVLPWPLYILFPMIWVSILMLCMVYDGSRNLHMVDELTSVTFGSFLATICLAGICYFSFRDLSRVMFSVFALATFLINVGWRIFMRLLFRFEIFRTASSRRVLIVGAGEVGQDLYSRMDRDDGLGVHVVGFLDDRPAASFSNRDCKILGRIDDMRSVLHQYEIDDVILALPVRAQEKVDRLVAELHDMPVKVWVIPSYFALALFKADVMDYAGVLMLDLRAPALNDFQRMMKRMFDLAVTLLSLPFALPVMALAAFLIYLDGGGPIIFRQKRVGENGKLFVMYKFRTMVNGAEALQTSMEQKDPDGNLIYKIENDPRVTGIGRFLRATSLDELPQLFNVLKGEMSLVGPRPELPFLVERYETWQRKRFAIPQGITGWWQINGRSDKPMHLHTEDDLFYVQNYSIWLDLQILFKTFWVALSRKGAY